MDQHTCQTKFQGKREAPLTADNLRPAKKICSKLNGGDVQAEHDNKGRSSLGSKPPDRQPTKTFDAEVMRQMQLKSLANARFDTGVVDALTSLEEIDELDLLDEPDMDESRFEAKQAREIQRLEWLKRELDRLSDTTERALRSVEGSDSEAGLGYDRIVADELGSIARELGLKIGGDARCLAHGDKWVDF